MQLLNQAIVHLIARLIILLLNYTLFVVTSNGGAYKAKAVIVATGATARYLGLPGEKELIGHGLTACATCDGYFYRGKMVAVVGGGDTAVEEATYLAKLVKKVYLIHRRDELRASKAMQNRLFKTENVEMVWDSIPKEITGKQDGFAKSVTGVIVENVKTGAQKTIDIDGFFVAIGHKPNSDMFKGKLDMDETGYLITKPDSTATRVPGIFAAGDVQDKVYRQAVTAAGTGCMAALEAERFLAAQD